MISPCMLQFRLCKLLFVLSSIIFLLVPLAAAISLECNDDGSLRIRDSLTRAEVTARPVQGEDNYFPVKGVWDSKEKTEGKRKVTYYSYESVDGIFVAAVPTKYYMKIGKKRYTVQCPVFSFSCRLLNQSVVESCYVRNNTFTGKFLINDLSISKKKEFRFANPYALSYNLQLQENNKIIRHTPQVFSEGFENFTITLKRKNDGNRFTLKLQTQQLIKQFEVYHQCEKSGFHIAKECSTLPLCEKNSECQVDEYCESGLCQKLDCDNCEYIEQHLCKEYQCCTDGECEQNELCINHSCKKIECQQNEIIKQHSCELLSCADDEITLNHSCEKVTCDFDEIAENHQCTKIICKEDEKLENHNCIPLQCKWYEKVYDHDCYTWYQYYKLKKEDKLLKD